MARRLCGQSGQYCQKSLRCYCCSLRHRKWGNVHHRSWSCCMIEPANAQTLRRPGANSLQGRTMCSWTLQRRQLWRNMSREQWIKLDMCGDRYCCQHQSSLHQPPGDGQWPYTPYWTRLPELHWAGFLQVPKRVCVVLQMQEGRPSMHSPLCVWRGLHMTISPKHRCTCGTAEVVNMTLFMYTYLQYQYIPRLRYYTMSHVRIVPKTFTDLRLLQPFNMLS